MQQKFRKNQIVWACRKDQIPWPAIIKRVNEDQRNYRILLINYTKQEITIGEEFIEDYRRNRQKFSKGNLSAKLSKAINIADTQIENRTKIQNNGTFDQKGQQDRGFNDQHQDSNLIRAQQCQNKLEKLMVNMMRRFNEEEFKKQLKAIIEYHRNSKFTAEFYCFSRIATIFTYISKILVQKNYILEQNEVEKQLTYIKNTVNSHIFGTQFL